MNKSTILITLTVLVPFIIQAQKNACDTLITADGRILEVSIEKVTDLEVLYSNCTGKSESRYAMPVSNILEIRSAHFQRKSGDTTTSTENGFPIRSACIYLGPILYTELPYNEPFGGAEMAIDLRIWELGKQSYFGATVSLGRIVALYNDFESGNILKAGPKLYRGKEKAMTTYAVQYFQFKNCGTFDCQTPFRFKGITLSVGRQFTRKRGFFFNIAAEASASFQP